MPQKSWQDLMNDAGGANGDWDPLPQGDYDFYIKECESKQAKNTGNQMYVAKCAVETGPKAGRVVYNNFVIAQDSPAALNMFFRNMNLLGLTGEWFAQNPSDHQVAETLVGRRFRGTVVVKLYQGQERNEIKSIHTALAAGAPAGLPTGIATPGPAAPVPSPAPVPAPAYAAPVAAPAPAPAPQVQEAAPIAPPPIQQPATPNIEVASAPVAPPPPPPLNVAPPAAPAFASSAAAAAEGEVPPPPF